jgi:hypothetical protein
MARETAHHLQVPEHRQQQQNIRRQQAEDGGDLDRHDLLREPQP